MELTDRFRPLFPITEARAYLFAGGLAPAASPVRAALDEWTNRWMFDPAYHRARYFEEWGLLRSGLAAVLGGDPGGVSLVDNTSRASNLAVQMIDPSPGANIVIDETSHPSAVWPWLLPGRTQVGVREAPAGSYASAAERVASVVDRRTAAVIVSHIDARTGFRHDLRTLAGIAHEAGARLIVDAAQSAGAAVIDAEGDGVDFLAGTVMKWLLGPPGVGFLYVRRRIRAELTPPHVGYAGADCIDSPPRPKSLFFRPGGARHEIGLAALPCAAAARRGVDIILEAGLPAVESHVLELTGCLIEGLEERGIEVLTPSSPAERGGVTAFRCDGAVDLCRRLRTVGVDVWGYPEDDRVRADPHLYNTPGDVDRLLEGIDRFGRRRQRSITVGKTGGQEEAGEMHGAAS